MEISKYKAFSKQPKGYKSLNNYYSLINNKRQLIFYDRLCILQLNEINNTNSWKISSKLDYIGI